MTHLYLVQHGAAKAEAEDPKRGLTDEGRRTVERMAEFLSNLHLPLDRFEHSGKLRAKRRLKFWRRGSGPPRDQGSNWPRTE